MLDKNTKEKIIKKFKAHKNDTGSPEVQIAILTEEVKRLTKHLKTHKQDHSSRRGLLKKIGERKRLLKYLQKEDEEAFKNVSSKLNLRIAKKMEKEEETKRQFEEQLDKKGKQKPENNKESNKQEE